MTVPVVVLTAGVALTGTLLFIFKASSSGFEAADAVTAPLLGLGSRLMTGMAEVDAVGRGAARRLLRVVVEALVEGGGLEAAMSGEETAFSDSGPDR